MPKPKAKTAKPPRHERVTVLVNASELARLDGAAEQQGISRSDVLRRAILEYPLPTTSRRA